MVHTRIRRRIPHTPTVPNRSNQIHFWKKTQIHQYHSKKTQSKRLGIHSRRNTRQNISNQTQLDRKTPMAHGIRNMVNQKTVTQNETKQNSKPKIKKLF